jgi:alanine-glyoxylate transaminase/serine-glyoxylate transaminase/serine-pyruvate transaminase
MVKMAEYGELKPSLRILMGPGPSDVHPRVLKAMSTPLIGHLDPEFLKIMDDVQELLRYVFQTKNQFTIPVSGTGSAGMETCLVNLIEEGDEVVVGVNGVFGERMSDIVSRCGGKLTRVDAEWGKIIPPEKFRDTVKGKKVKLIAVVHAETSTGACQPLEDIAKIAHDAGALFLVDAVTSLGGCPVKLDEWGIDACYSGTQKCLSAPPGLSPVSFNEKARQVFSSRKKKVQSWYLDMTMVEKYWGKDRTYHHTAPITMVYGLREALRLIHEEGLENRFKRHELNHTALREGLNALGISMFAQEGHRLWMLNTVRVPDGVDEARVRKRLLDEFNIEIGGGLGVVKGKIWRVGLMGYSSSKENVLYFLSSLEKILRDEGHKFEFGAGVASASRNFANI